MKMNIILVPYSSLSDEQRNVALEISSDGFYLNPEMEQKKYITTMMWDILPLLRQQLLWTDRIPGMLNGYFADMEEALRQIFKSLKPGGHCSIVVSNSAYAGIIVPTDLFLAMIAERLGYKVNEIAVERLINKDQLHLL